MDNAHKALAVAAMLVMIVSCTAILVSDQSAAAGENDESGNFGSGDVFSWTYTAADKKLVFEYTPTDGMGDMPSQGSDRVGDGDWMDLSGAVESVEFRNISGIGSCLLTGFTALTSVSTDTPITFIGGSAFYGCTSLDPSNLIADGLTYIGANAFEGTAMSGFITIPGSVTQIGKSAFQNTDISGVTFEAMDGDTPLNIGNNAFSDCQDLEAVVFEDDVPPTLGNEVFKTGPKFSVPEGSASDYESALAGKTGDSTVSVNEYVAYIGDTGYVTLSSALDAAPADRTKTVVILETDIEVTEPMNVVSGQNITIDLNGKKITVSDTFSGKIITNYGMLSITGNGSIGVSEDKTGFTGVVDNYGELIVENGTFTGNLSGNGALFYNRSGGTATFDGGYFSGAGTDVNTFAGSNTTINGGTYVSPWYPAFENRGEALITGGTFTNTSCSSCDPYHWGYTIRNGLNSDSAHLVIKPADGSEVKVTGTQGGVTSVEGTMEIYGGSFTTVDCQNNHGQAFYALYVAGETGKTSATIYDGVFTSYNRTAVYVGNSGDGGIQEEAVVVIHGGTFSVTDTSDPTKYKGIIFIDNETVNCPVAEVFGGSFSDSLPEDAIAPGYSVSNEGGQFVVDAITPEEAAASVETDGTTLYFETLADAIDYVPEGGTVTLVKDCEFGSMGISKGITLDLNGKKITVDIPDSAVYGFFFLSGDSTIKNGTIEDVSSDGNTRGGLNTVIVSEVGTSLTVQDVNISAYEPDTTDDYNYIVRAQNGAELILNGKTVIEEKAQTDGKLEYETETYGTVGIAVIGSSDSSYPTTATVNKGVTVDVSGFAMSGLGTSHNTLMTINGGSITSNHSTAIYHPQVGTLNIKGGVITGVTGVEIRSGTINMTGGEVHGANEGFDAEANANGTTTIAVGIAIVQHTTTNAINVNITGGTITGYRALTEANTQNNQPDPTNITISLSGGKFIGVKDDTTTNSSVTAEDVESFIDGGTYVLADAAGNETADESLNESDVMVDGFKVGETGSIILESGEPTVATINGTPYGSLEKAIEAAESGQTIVLQADTTESITISSDLSITLNLNGHTITNTGGKNTITVEGELTIIDDTGNGKIDNTSNGKSAIYNKGTVTIKSGNITKSVNKAGNTYYVVFNHGTMSIEGGHIYSDGTAASSLIVNGYSQSATMTISGGHIEFWFNAVKNEEYGKLTVTGGTIDSDHQSIQNWNVATITGGTFNGEVATWHYNANNGSHTMTIEGGIFNGDVYTAKYVDDLETGDIGAITADPQITIKGGVFNGGLFTIKGDLTNSEILTPTEDENYDWMDVSGGTFTRPVEDRFLASGFVLEGTDGNYGVGKANKVTFDVNVSGATISVTSTDGSIVYSPEDDGTYLLASGQYRVVVNAEGYQTWDKTVTISGEGAIEITLSVEQTPGTIYESGQIVTVTATDGEITVPVNGGPHSNVTLTVRFGGDSVTVNGTVTDDVTVSYAYLNAQGSDLAFELSIDGVSDTDMTVTIRIPVELGDDEIIDPDSVYVYSVVGGVQTRETAYASGSEIVIVTNHNTPFYVSYDVMTLDTPVYPPFIPGDDDDVVIPPTVVVDQGSSDDDEAVKIVACAACAVVAAFLAAVMLFHRRD